MATMMTAARDVARISYDDVGRGEPALLFLHGWGANRTVWRQVVERTSQHRRAIAIDWPGHGQSSMPEGDFGERELIEYALAVIEASGAREIIAVPNAHAGWVAIELRRRLGERIRKIVLVDWLVLNAPAPFLAALEMSQDPMRWEQARDGLLASWLPGVTNRDEIRFVRETMGAVPFAMWARAGREISAAYAAAGNPLKALAALTPPVPTLHIYATPDDPGYLAAQEAFAAEHPWFQVRKLAIPGHFPMLSAPDDVAALIEQFATAR